MVPLEVALAVSPAILAFDTLRAFLFVAPKAHESHDVAVWHGDLGELDPTCSGRVQIGSGSPY